VGAVVLCCLPRRLGLTLPVLALLAFWPVLHARRAGAVRAARVAALRTVALSTLTASRWRCTATGLRLRAAPDRAGHVDAERQARLESFARGSRERVRQFALAWHSRRGGRLEASEHAYRAALHAWPGNTAILTDLGNVAAMRGHTTRRWSSTAGGAGRRHDAAAHYKRSAAPVGVSSTPPRTTS